MPRLSGRSALITGSGRGIGRETAMRFAEEGARVAVVTRGTASGQQTVDDIVKAGGSAQLFQSDVASRAGVRDAVRNVLSAFRTLDIVVHNAALAMPNLLDAITDDRLDDAIGLNLKAAFWLVDATLPSLSLSPHARLLFTSSITGNRIANAGFSVYGTTKAGLNGFIRQAAVELGPRGIRVNGVEPGVTLTPAAVDFLGGAADRVGRSFPLLRATRPGDIAAALAFLASDDAMQITGQTIIVDGGQSLSATDPGGDFS